MFEYINELSDNDHINVICNNDIYFDNTLKLKIMILIINFSIIT